MKIDSNYLKISKDLHENWKPHEGQMVIIQKLASGVNNLFIQCGRKFGKSELCIYLLWRHALLNPGSSCYYLAPFMKQAKEIIWASRRLQTFCSADYIESIDNTELRIKFKNGSFIKVDGSDNFESYRGITPHMVVYDEFKDFRPEFHEGMAPNLAAKGAPLIIIGTPPKPRARNYMQYISIADEFKEDDECFWVKRSSHDNPHISHKWLEKEKEKLIARGEEDVWQREYLAEIVGGGKQALFSEFDKNRHTGNVDKYIKHIQRYPSKWEKYVVVNPSITTCFATLFVAIHEYSREIVILDEIYEVNKSNMSSSALFQEIVTRWRQIGIESGDWFLACNSKSSWFSEEIMMKFGNYFTPVKVTGEEGISLLKQIFSFNLITISESNSNLIWEIENYAADNKNNLPKDYNYVIECLKILLSISNYSTVELKEAKKVAPDEIIGRFRAPEFDEFRDKDEWGNFTDKYFKT